MIAIVDYGMGNLHSVSKAIERLGREATIVSEAEQLHSATGIILPGVGAFGDAMDALQATGLGEELRKLVLQGKPLLGICLGMQLLFDSSEEYGQHKGLGLLPGRVVRFPQSGYKVPHMGWNSLNWKNPEHTLVKELAEDYVYFVHSYHVEVEEPSDLLATTEYADREVTAIVVRDNVYGMQFHPEKSGSLGLKLLEQFLTKVVAVSISNK
ncbi:imidazole glycerol phosphate synthase subunit HisH [Paenibacillus sp. SC116]|uniref:imidazole glycerol phosphate synthase subunit HisH n=1 Tax=Paenibacillus sp. SC116 TaxID=2968986 RepID=UPI00215B18C6|nr:imidazole glycerol phosphate synthase subunit HisH [Paenibacillus sp. SC116]MCR8844885.1 imidazole glycerol phosphate synthase subunit HisH [Paenibacillus sp. SC116]